MKCPKCGSPLRASKQKKDYFLCDTCRTRMSLEYINKMSASSSEPVSKPCKKNYSTNKQKQKKKLFPTLLIIFFLLIGCTVLFLHFGLYEKIVATISPSEQSHALIESVDIRMLDYEIISENINPEPSYEHEYLLVNVEISNNSSENLSVDSMHNFEGYVDNLKVPYCADSEDVLRNFGYTRLSSKLASDESVTGYLCFELPYSWEALEIHYSPIIWSSTNLTLQIKKKVS